MAPDKKIVNLIKNGGVGVMPTDTIYGIVGSALNKKAVERIYKLRRRNKNKPMIILIGSLRDLSYFGVKANAKTARLLKAIWFYPKRHTNILENVGISFCGEKHAAGRITPVSVVLPISHLPSAIHNFKYLHRGTKTLAFRLPKPSWLRKLLLKTGPLVAPSANLEGKMPARNIKEAKKYFKNNVDFYVDGGVLRSRPSKLIKIIKGKTVVLRE